MPIDTSIYNNIKQFEAPSIVDAQSNAMKLSQMGMQNQKMQNDMSAEDQQRKQAEQMQKTHAVGSALESMSGLSPQERTRMYPQVRNKLVSQGLLGENDAPAEYDDGFYKQNLYQYQQTKDYLEKQKTKGDIASGKMDLNYKTAQINKMNAEAGIEGRKSGVEYASKLRAERSGLPTTKATQDVSAAFNKIQAAAKVPSAAGDMSMIFGYMKMLDPGSTVREGEFANAQNAAGVPTRILNLYEKARTGERLAPEQRDDFLGQAKGLYSAQISQQNKIDKDYERLAIKQGISPDDVLMNFGADLPEEQDKQQMPSPLAANVKKQAQIIPDANAGSTVNTRVKTIKPDLKEYKGFNYVKVKGGWERDK